MKLMKFTSSALVAMMGLLASVNAQSTISAGRAIKISIQGVPSEEMGRVANTYPVSESGYIRMPFLGAVRAAGMSSSRLAQVIEERYKSAKIYTSPTIQIISNSSDRVEEHFVTVGGQVKRSGKVPYNKGLTLYDAVQSAGGPTPFGSMRRVSLIRKGKMKEYNMKEIEAQGVVLQPEDRIHVPQKNWLGW